MSYRFFVCLIVLFACFYGLGSYPLLDDNEGLYAAVARDMLHTHQFIIPHLNGVPYLEKPPLLYWLTALSMALFGETAAAAHLIPALALCATAYLMWRMVFRATRCEAAAATAAIIFVTSLPLLGMGRMLLCDMLMTCFLSAALLCFYEWHNTDSKRNLLGLYAFLALAVLTKGFVTLILAGGAIVTFLLWQRSPRQRYLEILSPRGMVLFLIIAAPWHIAAMLQDPGFAWFYFVNEHILRFLNLRQPHDYYSGPPWYYLPRILAYLLPWTPLLALVIRRPMLTAQTYPALTRFLWAWFLFCFMFFSLSGAKANYYMIAGIPALVMLLALQLQQRFEANSRAAALLAASCPLLVIAALWGVRYFCRASSGDLYSSCEAVSWPAIGGATAYAAAVVVLCRRIPRRWTVPLLGTYIFWALPLMISGIAAAGGYASQKPVADYLKESGYHEVALYQEFDDLSALAFYMERPILMVDSLSSDLSYGRSSPEGKPYFLMLSQWAARTPPLPMVVLNKRLDRLMKSLQESPDSFKNICVLRRFERVALISRCD